MDYSATGQVPRLRRYTLGERIETLLLQVLERLLEAAYSSGRDKTRALQRASQHLNVVRHLWRLSHELKAVPPRAHAHGAERLVQLGRQLGGWQRHAVAASNGLSRRPGFRSGRVHGRGRGAGRRQVTAPRYYARGLNHPVLQSQSSHALKFF